MKKLLVTLLVVIGIGLLVNRIYDVVGIPPEPTGGTDRLSSSSPPWTNEEPERVKLQPDTYNRLYKFVSENGKPEDRGQVITCSFPKGRSSISLFSDKDPAILLVWSHIPGDTLEAPSLFFHIDKSDEAEIALPDTRKNIEAIRPIVDTLLTEI